MHPQFQQKNGRWEMEPIIIFVLRQRSDWKVVIGEQRIGAHKTAEAACWSAMALALQLRQDGSVIELRMHDENGIQRVWPPEQVVETKIRRLRSRSVAA
jgi:hypothetical protein